MDGEKLLGFECEIKWLKTPDRVWGEPEHVQIQYITWLCSQRSSEKSRSFIQSFRNKIKGEISSKNPSSTNLSISQKRQLLNDSSFYSHFIFIFNFIRMCLSMSFHFPTSVTQVKLNGLKNTSEQEYLYQLFRSASLFSLALSWSLGMGRAIVVGWSCMHSLHAYLSLRANTLIEPSQDRSIFLPSSRFATMHIDCFLPSFSLLFEGRTRETKTKRSDERGANSPSIFRMLSLSFVLLFHIFIVAVVASYIFILNREAFNWVRIV